MRAPGFMRNTRPSVAYFSGVKVVNAVFTFADSKNTWDIHNPLLIDYQAGRTLFSPVVLMR